MKTIYNLFLLHRQHPWYGNNIQYTIHTILLQSWNNKLGLNTSRHGISMNPYTILEILFTPPLLSEIQKRASKVKHYRMTKNTNVTVSF